MLELVVKSAVLTHDTETTGRMDPYVKFVCDGKEYLTAVKDDAGKTPVWN